MTAFDPAAWLQAFEAVGGWYVVTSDDRINVGWMIENRTDDEHVEARRLFKEIEYIDDRWMALKALVLSRQRIPA
jgi:hypothetical protein